MWRQGLGGRAANLIVYLPCLLSCVLFYVLAEPLQHPWGGSLYPSGNAYDAVPVVLFACYVLHFVRRCAEVAWVHEYKRVMAWGDIVGGVVYYGVWGVWVGWSCASPPEEHSHWAWVVAGGLVFACGEIGNCVSHVMLARLMAGPREALISPGGKHQDSVNEDADGHAEFGSTLKSHHVIPRGFLFDHVSCPHYFCELLSWVGFALASGFMVSFAFLMFSAITLTIYARRRHHSYQERFDGCGDKPLYPAHRTALIPFLF